MPSTQKDNRFDVAQPLIPLGRGADGVVGGGRKEGRKGDKDASHWDKGPITRVTRGLLIAE